MIFHSHTLLNTRKHRVLATEWHYRVKTMYQSLKVNDADTRPLPRGSVPHSRGRRDSDHTWSSPENSSSLALSPGLTFCRPQSRHRNTCGTCRHAQNFCRQMVLFSCQNMAHAACTRTLGHGENSVSQGLGRLSAYRFQISLLAGVGMLAWSR